MIKSWSKFNENSSDNLRSQLASKLTEVRDVFTDLEDMGIIKYCLASTNDMPNFPNYFDPKRADFENHMNNIIPNIIWGNNQAKTRKKHNISEKDFCIITDIKLPGEPNEFGSTVIGNEGIKIFEDILVANSRLIDAGYDVKLDLNASHNAYKPVKFLIYFNI